MTTRINRIMVGTRQSQSGVTLVELMIGTLIGLALIAGLIQVFFSVRQATNLQDGLGNLQENGRFAVYFLERDMRLAGFPKESRTLPFLVGAGDTSNNVGPNNSDIITVQYQGNTDCLNQAVAGGLVNNRYFIALQNGENTLMCLGNGNATPQPLVAGIESLQALYGEDLDADGFPDTYVSVGNVTDWERVVSARVSLLASSSSNILDEDIAQSYPMLDEPAIGPFVDRVRRSVFTTSIEIRNRTP